MRKSRRLGNVIIATQVRSAERRDHLGRERQPTPIAGKRDVVIHRGPLGAEAASSRRNGGAPRSCEVSEAHPTCRVQDRPARRRRARGQGCGAYRLRSGSATARGCAPVLPRKGSGGKPSRDVGLSWPQNRCPPTVRGQGPRRCPLVESARSRPTKSPARGGTGRGEAASISLRPAGGAIEKLELVFVGDGCSGPATWAFEMPRRFDPTALLGQRKATSGALEGHQCFRKMRRKGHGGLKAILMPEAQQLRALSRRG